MTGNSFISGVRGPNNLRFNDGHHIRFGFPSFKLGGAVMGDRTIELYGCNYYEDFNYNRKAVVLCNTFKKSGWIKSTTSGSKDGFVGLIYQAKKLKDD